MKLFTNIYGAITFSVLLAISSISSAKEPVDELMEMSGMLESLESMPEALTAGLNDPSINTLAKKDRAELRTAFIKSFEPKVMSEDIRNYFKLALSNDEISSILEWLNSDLGKKITQLENEASTAQGQQNMMAQAESLMKNQELVAKMQEFDSALKMTDQTMMFTKNAQIALMGGVMAYAPKEQKMSFEQIESLVDAQEPMIKQQLSTQVLLSLLYSYQTLSDEEFEQYNQFLTSKTGRKYVDATLAGIDLAMSKAARKAGSALARVEAESKKAN